MYYNETQSSGENWGNWRTVFHRTTDSGEIGGKLHCHLRPGITGKSLHDAKK